MKFKTVFLTLFLMIFFESLNAESFDTLYVRADSLAENSIDVEDPWRYHSGDNIEWASPDYDHSKWMIINPELSYEEIEDTIWSGIGWFRKILVVDSALTRKQIAFRFDQFGASEIFLNGNKIHSYGKIGDMTEAESVYQPWNYPLPVLLDSNRVYTLAVRYSNQKAVTDKDWIRKWFRRIGFRMTLADLNTSINNSIESGKVSFAVNFGIGGLFLSLGALYAFLFLFYARRKENMFYSLFNIFIAAIFLTGMLRMLVHTNLNALVILSLISSVGIMLIFSSYLGFLYSIFYEKFPKQFWVFLSLALIISSFIFLYLPADVLNYLVFGFILLSTLEGLRVIIVALRSGKPNSWIIGTGVMIFVLFIIALFVLGILGINVDSFIAVFLFLLGLFSLPISMSIYLAKDIATTNKNLEKQLVTVKELSEKHLQQERRNAELKLQSELAQAEIARKTEELEEARQLQLSMLPKELPKLPHLDIAVYMQTATEVGGDYYDFHVNMDGALTVVLGDATGHGMKAGTMVTAVKGLFASYAPNDDIIYTFHEITRCLKQLNLAKLSMCMTMLKISNSKLSVSTAGMPPLLIYREKEKKVEEFVIKGMPLGTFEEFPYSLRETTVSQGDTILLMSDGFPELMNHSKEIYGYKNAKKAFESAGHEEPESIIESLRKEIEDWLDGKAPEDDVTFVVLKVK